MPSQRVQHVSANVDMHMQDKCMAAIMGGNEGILLMLAMVESLQPTLRAIAHRMSAEKKASQSEAFVW